jgi:hypothetical protein
LKTGYKEAQRLLHQATEQGMLLISANENTSMQSITRTFDALRDIINDYEKALKSQIREIEEKNNKLTENYLTILKEKQRTLSNCIKNFEKILSTNDPTQLLEAKTRLTDEAEQLTKELKELKAPIKTEYRLEEFDQLQASVDNILKKARVDEQKPGNSFNYN